MLDDLIYERERKLKKYEEKTSAYPAEVYRGETINDVLQNFSDLEKKKDHVTIVGRLFSWRDQGKIIFADTEDATGRIQIVLNKKDAENFILAKETFDIGDFVEAHGIAFTTNRGEKSILIEKIRIISKNLRPIPATWYGLEDIETILRKRYLDLLTKKETRDLFIKKSIFWDETRKFLKDSGFLEVEMPVFESVPGGAEAEPFVTHHNALDQDFYLRISLELPLKKILVGGFEKVFEIGRIFRNEGIDREHLQDYTQMECYAAYWNYEDMMKFVEKMYKTIIKNVFGSLALSLQGHTIDWGEKWERVDYYSVFQKETGIDLKTAAEDDLKKEAMRLGIREEAYWGRGRIIDLIYKKVVRPKLIKPSFLTDPPVCIEPLAKRLEKDSDRVARFQIMALGTELGKGFSELNDPRDQRKRFEEQMKLREKGDKEAQRLDEDFLEALEYGMPPAAGFGMSERLFAVLADKSVRETVFFPLMRREDDNVKFKHQNGK